jgi:hypothetical protein
VPGQAGHRKQWNTHNDLARVPSPPPSAAAERAHTVIGLLIALLLLWLTLTILGILIKGLLWLALTGIVLFVITGIIAITRTLTR